MQDKIEVGEFAILNPGLIAHIVESDIVNHGSNPGVLIVCKDRIRRSYIRDAKMSYSEMFRENRYSIVMYSGYIELSIVIITSYGQIKHASISKNNSVHSLPINHHQPSRIQFEKEAILIY